MTRARRLYTGAPTRGMVAMLYIGRSGSSVLADLLAQHSKINWGAELFDKVRKNTPGYRSTRPWLRSVIESRAAKKRCEYFGFETQQSQLGSHCIGMSPAEYLGALEEIGFTHFIVLTRGNLLRLVVSHLVAQETRTLHVDVEVTKPTRIHIDPDAPWGGWAGSLIDVLNVYERFYAELRELLRDRRLLELNYEAHIEQGPAIAYDKVCAFLDLRPEPFTILRARTNPFSIEEMVTNFEEIAAALRNSRFEWMLTA